MRSSWRAVLVALAAVAAVLVPPAPQAQAADRVLTYSVTSQGTVRGDLGQFAAVAAATFADPRGWSLGGALAFSRVPSGGDFTLVLAAPSVIGRLAGCDAFYSCRVGRNVYINDDRWRTATSTWPHGVPYYQQYVITHEVGQWLGLGHSTCPGAGRLAPTMQQQSIDLQGCRSNMWPLIAERERVARNMGTGVAWTAIERRYRALGQERGPLGGPITWETPTPGNRGVMQHFDRADGASIYWSPSTDAHEVYGQIRAHWAGWAGNWARWASRSPASGRPRTASAATTTSPGRTARRSTGRRGAVRTRCTARSGPAGRSRAGSADRWAIRSAASTRCPVAGSPTSRAARSAGPRRPGRRRCCRADGAPRADRAAPAWWDGRVDDDLQLHGRTLGEAGPRVVFLHGLFGQGKNWTTVAKGLADRHRVTLLDLPNHGHSPWTDRVDYLDMAELVAAELAGYGEPVTLVGHSMGGKVAMTLALRRPQLLRALVVVDIAPVEYPLQGGRTDDEDEEVSPFGVFIAAMKAMDLDALRTREDADAALRTAVPSRMVRSFLLQSLVRGGAEDGGWRWRLNLDLLERDLGELRGFPEPPAGATFDGPVLWIAGATSHYVLPQDRERMDALFPATRLVRIKQAGHWVHSEQPEVFLETLRRFLEQVED